MMAFDIARSGLAANMMRLTASASNIANANSLGSVMSSAASSAAGSANQNAYQPVGTIRQSMAGGGVTSTYSRVSPSSVVRYDPSSQNADNDGLVAAPNVNLINESVVQIETKLDFQANIATIRAANAMQKSTIDLLA